MTPWSYPSKKMAIKENAWMAIERPRGLSRFQYLVLDGENILVGDGER